MRHPAGEYQLIVYALVVHQQIFPAYKNSSDKYPGNLSRSLENPAVIETCADGSAELSRYRELHQEYPQRKICFLCQLRRQEIKVR